MPDRELTRVAWRVGRKVGRTIYAQDTLIGVMDTRLLAERVVDDHNRALGFSASRDDTTSTP